MPDRRTLYVSDDQGRTWGIRVSRLLGIEARVDGRLAGEVQGEAVRRVLESAQSPDAKATPLMDALKASLSPDSFDWGEQKLRASVIDWVIVASSRER